MGAVDNCSTVQVAPQLKLKKVGMTPGGLAG